MWLKNNLFLVLLLIIAIIVGGFFRLAFNKQIYTDYDDVEVIGLYKTNSPGRSVDFNLGNIINLKVNINMGALKNELLNSWLFPIFTAYVWTYPPGQYIFFPMVMSESDSYSQKLQMGRGISGAFSLLGIFIFLLLLYRLSGNKLKDDILIPIIVLSFAFNFVLYSHHMSPYAASATTFILVLLFLVMAMEKKISFSVLFILFSALTYFNYLIILLLLPAFLVLVCYQRIFKLFEILKKFTLPFLFYIVIFLPGALLFFKPGSGLRGATPPEFSLLGIFKLLYLVFAQFINTLSSTAAFFTGNIIVNTIFVLAIVCIAIYFFVSDWRKKDERGIIWYLVGFIFIFWLEWIILWIMKDITMARSRHVLMWTPAFCLLLYYIFSRFKYNKYIYYIAALVLIILAAFANYRFIQEKFSVVDYQLIKSYKNNTTILTYNNGAGNSDFKLYFPDKKIYDIRGPQYNLLSKELLLYSQHYSIEELKIWGPEISDLTAENVKKLFNDYNYEPIKEIKTDKYFTFDNYSVSTCPNNFYLYKLIRK